MDLSKIRKELSQRRFASEQEIVDAVLSSFDTMEPPSSIQKEAYASHFAQGYSFYGNCVEDKDGGEERKRILEQQGFDVRLVSPAFDREGRRLPKRDKAMLIRNLTSESYRRADRILLEDYLKKKK